MKLSADKIDAHLARTLAPVYLITGDEPLLVAEAADAVRRAAREQAYTERELKVVERGFDWAGLASGGANLSLFSERRIVELRMTSPKPGDAGGKALIAWASSPPEDTLLLITTPKMDKSTQGTKWVKTIEKQGALVQVWPIDIARLPRWVEQRMIRVGLQPDREAVELIAGRVEGNLLAAQQEIDKLLMLCGPGPVDGETARRAVADSARFDVFQLADAALLGDAPRTERILLGLRGEGVDPVLINWALVRELRGLASMAGAMEAGHSLQRAMADARVWERRRPLIKAAVERHGHRRLLQLLDRGGEVDRCIKGQVRGQAWDMLLRLALALAGVRASSAVTA